jgi:tetratricopeptide (TPR) repeat protein
VRRGWLKTLGVLSIAGALLQAPTSSLAQEGEAPAPKSQREIDKEKLEQQRARSVDQQTAKKLNEIFELYNAEKYGEARGKAGGLNMERLSPYEQSRVYQILAAIDLREEKYSQAQVDLDKALASGGLNDQETDSVRFQLVQIYMAQERWKEGIDAWKKWAASALTPPKSAEYYTLAIAYYQSGDLKSALDPAEKAVNLATG